ncbi:MAG TPA: hypothetical protein V6C95_09825 [Coleofasciculaceae cyanobacterium]
MQDADALIEECLANEFLLGLPPKATGKYNFINKSKIKEYKINKDEIEVFWGLVWSRYSLNEWQLI